MNAPAVQTFLQCTYDDKTYQKEIDRLENCHKTYGKEVREFRKHFIDEVNKIIKEVEIAVNSMNKN